MLSKEEVNCCEEILEKISHEAEDIYEKFCMAQYGHCYYGYEFLTIRHGDAIFERSRDGDTDWVYMPLEYLYNPNEFEECAERKRFAEERARNELLETQRISMEAVEANERALYQQLKDKYEGKQ